MQWATETPLDGSIIALHPQPISLCECMIVIWLCKDHVLSARTHCITRINNCGQADCCSFTQCLFELLIFDYLLAESYGREGGWGYMRLCCILVHDSLLNSVRAIPESDQTWEHIFYVTWCNAVERQKKRNERSFLLIRVWIGNFEPKKVWSF